MKRVYVQILNVDKAAVIDADSVERVMDPPKLVIKKADIQVGEFRIDQVSGWWIQDESDSR